MKCPRCGREATGWPLRRGDRCSPAYWVECIREPEDILAAAAKAVEAKPATPRTIAGEGK